MSEDRKYVIVPIKQFTETPTGDSKTAILQVFPYKSFKTDKYGTDTFDKERAERFAKNFNDNVRGIDLATNFEHCLDQSKGHQASGWYRGMEVRDDGLFATIEFTEDAAKEIQQGKWKYFSPEWLDEWTDTDGNKHNDVLIGGALTNKPVIKGQQPINFSEVKDEVSDIEHSEPGEVVPRQDDNANPNDDNRGGHDRFDGPPAAYEDENMAELDKALRQILGLKPEDDLVAAVKQQHDELEPLRVAAERAEKKKEFSEQYPEEARRLAALEESERDTKAKAFAESYTMFKDKDGAALNKGFPGVVTNALEGLYKEFGEGKANMGSIANVLNLVAEHGVIEYSERGSRRTEDDNDDNNENPAKMFSEKVTDIMEKDDLPRMAALAEATKRFPDLAAAYQRSVSVVR